MQQDHQPVTEMHVEFTGRQLKEIVAASAQFITAAVPKPLLAEYLTVAVGSISTYTSQKLKPEDELGLLAIPIATLVTIAAYRKLDIEALVGIALGEVHKAMLLGLERRQSANAGSVEPTISKGDTDGISQETGSRPDNGQETRADENSATETRANESSVAETSARNEGESGVTVEQLDQGAES